MVVLILCYDAEKIKTWSFREEILKNLVSKMICDDLAPHKRKAQRSKEAEVCRGNEVSYPVSFRVSGDVWEVDRNLVESPLLVWGN